MAFVPFDFFGLLVLIIVGLIIVALIRIFLVLPPAAILAIMVWFLTEST